MESPRGLFKNTLSKFMSNLQTVFDDDSRIPLIASHIETQNIDEVIEKFHSTMKEHETALKERDVDKLSQIELLAHLDIKEKFNDETFDEESREAFWLYVDKLYSYASLDRSIPSAIKNDIFQVARSVAESGDISVAFKKAEQLASQITEDDSKEIMSSLKGMMSQIPPEVISSVMQNPQFSEMMKTQFDVDGSSDVMSHLQNALTKNSDEKNE